MRGPSEFDAEPALGDEYDPEEREDLFQTFRYLGWTPSDIKTDPRYAELYAKWLKTAPPDED